MRWLANSLVLLVLLAVNVSCGSKGAISLSASIANPKVSITEQTLGLDLAGSFDLSLAVGPEADGAATVTIEKFSLVSAADQSALVETLDVSSGELFPTIVAKGQQKTITFLIQSTKLLETSLKPKLCAGDVKIVGTVHHNLNGGETKPVQSGPVPVTGC